MRSPAIILGATALSLAECAPPLPPCQSADECAARAQADAYQNATLLNASAMFLQMGQPSALPYGAYRLGPQVTTCSQPGSGFQCVTP
jgi:hypothetical protein